MAKRTKEEQDQLNTEYRKELRKLKRRVRGITKRGYSVPSTIIPPVPKTINPESIENIRKRTTDYIYARSVYVSSEGTKIKGTERRAQERSEAAKKGAETRKRYYAAQKLDEYWAEPSWEPEDESGHIFQVLVEDFETWTAESRWSEELQQLKTSDVDRARGILRGLRNEYGDMAIAQNASANATEINELVMRIFYESGNKYRDDSRNNEINMAINKLAALLKGSSLTRQESIRYTAEAEQYESYENPI